MDIISSLPRSTGIYIMKDQSGKPIYVGKAKNIKIRVKSYFQGNGKDGRPQIPFLLKEIKSFDYIVTNNERDALLLENSLIKKHKPKYNIQLKDDKTYASLRLSINDKFPRLSFTRKLRNDGAAYFGPFASGGALKQTARLVHKLFPIRDCTDGKFRNHRDRPCLHYYLNMCSGPCAGKITVEKYGDIVEQARIFLSGDKKKLIKVLEKKMFTASEDMRYEDAAYYRDQIKYLKKNLEAEKFKSSNLKEKDIIGFHKDSNNYEFVVLFSRDGSVVDKSQFSLNNKHLTESQVLREFVGRLYHDHQYIPTQIVVQESIEDKSLYEELLTNKKGKKVEIVVPKRGLNLKLLDLAKMNAKENYSTNIYLKNKELYLLERLKNTLSLKRTPRNIECFDISNTQGDNSVASMVRFTDGLPDKKRYRRFKIKSVIGPDDFASLKEVLLIADSRLGL